MDVHTDYYFLEAGLRLGLAPPHPREPNFLETLFAESGIS